MKLRNSLLLLVLVCVLLVAVRLALVNRPSVVAQGNSVAVNAVNAFGIDLLRKAVQPGDNVLLSPYSIQLALVMTCAGADGQTRDEMVHALHYPKHEDELNHSFAALQANVNGIMNRESALAQQSLQQIRSIVTGVDDKTKSRLISELEVSLTNSLLTLTTVNRLYGQSGHDIRPDYLKLLKDNWQASFESVDFLHNASGVTTQINSWLQNQTHGRIQNLIPSGALDENSRLVLVNAIYLKAHWMHSFSAELTQPGPFHLSDGMVIQVPTMSQPHEENFLVGYAHRGGLWSFLGRGYTAIALPYNCPELQFVILMPDRCAGLAAFEASLTPQLLAGCTNLPIREADLFLPKFKLEPPTLSLVKALRALGMKSAFEPGANFDRTVLPRSGQPLYISGVFHKAFLQLDEAGTEASAGTSVSQGAYGIDTNIPVQVRVDRPFLFAIQHRTTSACLFLGRITDPR